MIIMWFRACVIDPFLTTLVLIFHPSRRRRIVLEWFLMFTLQKMDDAWLEQLAAVTREQLHKRGMPR